MLKLGQKTFEEKNEKEFALLKFKTGYRKIKCYTYFDFGEYSKNISKEQNKKFRSILCIYLNFKIIKTSFHINKKSKLFYHS